MKTIEEVGKVCEAFGMERVKDGHSRAWVSDNHKIAVAISGIGSSMSGVHVHRFNDVTEEESEQLVNVHPYTKDGAVLLSAVLSVLLKEGSDE